MKTTQPQGKLSFTKNALVELNDEQLGDVKGGSVSITLMATVTIAILTAAMAE